MIIQFNADGTGQCIHTEALPLSQIGTLNVNRASTVEFNNDSQEWEVKWPGSSEVAYSHASRLQCLSWEINELTARLSETGSACPL